MDGLVQLVKDEPWPTLVTYLDDLRARAATGELLGVFVVLKWKGDMVGTHWCAAKLDRRVIGAIEELKYELLQKLK